MKLKRIANNVALQTISYLIHGYTQVDIYFYDGYNKKEIYKGTYNQFFYNGADKYAYCRVTELYAEDDIVCIRIERQEEAYYK